MSRDYLEGQPYLCRPVSSFLLATSLKPLDPTGSYSQRGLLSGAATHALARTGMKHLAEVDLTMKQTYPYCCF